MLRGGLLGGGDPLHRQDGEAVIAGEVLKRVVGGDEFPPGGGEFRNLDPAPALELVQGGKVLLLPARVIAPVRGIRLFKPIGDKAGGPLHVLHTVPPVGILHLASLIGHHERGNRLAHIHELTRDSGGLLELGQESLHSLPREEDEIGLCHLLHIRGRRLKLMGIDARLDDRLYLHMGPPDVLCEIGRDGREGGHGEVGTARRGSEKERGQEQGKGVDDFHDANENRLMTRRSSIDKR